MIHKVFILKKIKGGDGRSRSNMKRAAIRTDRIVYLEHIGTWQDKTITNVRFDDGSTLDVLMSIDEIATLLRGLQE